MGLFDSLFSGSSSVENLTKEEAFCAVLLSIIAADGDISDEEVDDFHAIVNRVRLLKSVSSQAFKQIVAKLFRIMKKDGVSHLAILGCKSLPAEYHKGTLVMACDLVFSDGEVDTDEVKILELIKSNMTVDDLFAQKTIEVMKEKGSV